MMARAAPAIIKIGGSLAAAPKTLAAILEEIAQAAERGRAIVVVPGGGPFADSVRTAQQHFGTEDALAHDMALLAMAQYGLLLSGLAPLQAAYGLAPLRHWRSGAIADAKARIWLPEPARDALGVPRSWRITSDYLALWLAAELHVRNVVLVKACAAPPESAEAETLARLGVIDPAYPELAKSLPQIRTSVVFEASARDLRTALASAI